MKDILKKLSEYRIYIKSDKKDLLLLVVKVAFGLILLYAVFYKFDFSIFWEMDIVWAFLFITLANSLIITALRGLKWDMILSQLDQQRFPFKRILNLMLIGQFFAFFTPARLGDFGRAGYIKDKLGYKKSFASVIIDKLFDLMVIGIFAAFGFLYMGAKLMDLIKFHFTIAISIIGLLFVLTIFFGYIFREKLKGFYQILFDFEKGGNKKIFFYILLLAIVIWFLTYFQFYLAVLMVNVSAPVVAVIALASVYTVILFLPISINGIGIREVTAAVIFPLINIRAEIGVIIVWIVAINNSLFPAVLGYLSLLHEK